MCGMELLWTSITFYGLRGILLPLYLRAAQVLVSWMTAAAFWLFLKVQNSKLNAKVCTVQVHLLRSRPRAKVLD